MAADFSSRFELQLEYSSVDLSIPSKLCFAGTGSSPEANKEELKGCWMDSSPLSLCWKVQGKKELTRLAGKETKHVEEKT